MIPFRLLRELHRSLAVSISAQAGDMGTIQVVDDCGALRIVAQRGFRKEFLKHFKTVRVNDNSACGRAYRAASAVSIPDIREDVGFAPHRAIAEAAGFRAVQSAPLVKSDGNVNGVLSIHYKAVLPKPDWRLQMLYASALRTSVILDSFATAS
jgi:GAF domain-containing protein